MTPGVRPGLPRGRQPDRGPSQAFSGPEAVLHAPGLVRTGVLTASVHHVRQAARPGLTGNAFLLRTSLSEENGKDSSLHNKTLQT